MQSGLRASITRAAVAATAAVFLLLTGRAEAGDGALPFVPPVGWTQPTTLPEVPISWSKGLGSTFLVSPISTTFAAPLETISASLERRQAAYGKVASESRATVCGRPALRLAVAQDAGRLLVEQIQNLDGGTSLIVYIRPKGTAFDPSIRVVMANYCGKRSLASLKPPPGWTDVAIGLRGLWTSPSLQTITAMSFSPRSGTFSDDGNFLLSKVVRTPHATVTARVLGTLCGSPSVTYTVHATPRGAPPIDVIAEVTQSRTDAEMLIYGRLDGAAVDPAAIASLATLCARGSPSPPTPVPVSSASAVPTPTPDAGVPSAAASAATSAASPSASPSLAAPRSPAPLAPATSAPASPSSIPGETRAP